MEEDLPEDIIEDENDSENEDNELSDRYEDFNKITQVNNMERGSASRSLIVTSPSSSRSLTPFSDIFQEEDSTIKENSTSQTLNSQSSVQLVNTVQRDKFVMEEHELGNLEGDYTMQQQTTFNSQQIQSATNDTNEQIVSAQDDFTSNQKRIIKDKKNQNFIDLNNSNDYVPSKKHHIWIIQEASNNSTSQHNIYQQ
ncbi:2275_t:CDS:2, partial [Racocetra fulgida]